MSATYFALLLAFGLGTALVLFGAAIAKISGKPTMRDAAEHFSIRWTVFLALGIAELVLAVGVLVGIRFHGLGVIAGVAVFAMMLTAVIFHARAKDTITTTLPALGTLIASGVYVAVQVANMQL